MIPKAKKSKIIYFFFAFFAVVLAVNIFYIYISKKTWRGVITDDPYHKGLNYNDTLKEVAKQKVLGWIVKVDFRSGATKQGIMMLTVQDKNMRYINDAKIYVTFKRPAQEGLDFVLPVPFEDGVYKAKIDLSNASRFFLCEFKGKNCKKKIYKYKKKKHLDATKKLCDP
jgi:nitrogen fixation protein FixH